MTTFRLLPFLLLTAAILLRPAPVRGAEPPKNVLLISIDDLNNQIAPYGDFRYVTVATPNFDRLAARGVAFRRAQCQFPWCNPSRASLLTGLRPDVTRIYDLVTPVRRFVGRSVPFLPEYFRQQGYYAARAGKIHHESNGVTDDPFSWDVAEAANDGNLGALTPTGSGAIPAGGTTGGYRGSTGLEWNFYNLPANDVRFGDVKVANAVVAQLAARAGNPQPFFIAAGFRKPHEPWNIPKSFADQYPASAVTLPAEPALAAQEIPNAATNYNSAHPNAPEALRKEAIAAYCASIAFMDRQLGVILDQMDALNLWQSTVVLLFSDHGFQLGEHEGMWEKMRLFPESLEAPLIIAAPQGAAGAGSVCARPVEMLDIFPTLTQLAGVPTPDHLQGRSLAPFLVRPDRPAQKPAYSQRAYGTNNTKAGRSVQTDRWLYVEHQNGTEGKQLYDVTADPRGLNNLAGDAGFAATEAEMRALLLAGFPGPTALGDAAFTRPNTAVTVDALFNDSDPQAGPAALAVQSVGPTPSGTVAIVGGKVVFTPAADFVGSVSFPYTISDGANTGTGRITVSVQKPYQQPTLATDPDGTLCIEAESFDNRNVVSNREWTWSPVGGGYPEPVGMQAQPDGGQVRATGTFATAARLDFYVNFTQTGTHYVWVRGINPGSTSAAAGDSCHVAFDNAESATSDNIGTFPGAWAWRNSTADGPVATLEVPTTGTHLVHLWMHEDGCGVDKIVLTKNSAYVPPDTGLTSSRTTQFLAPSNLVAAAASSRRVNLEWIENSSGETGFEIERRVGASGAWTLAHVAPPDATTWSDHAADTPGATYSYRLRRIGGTTYSNVASATTRTLAADWRLTHFQTTENTGDAAAEADPDRDGRNNALERFLAGNPRRADAAFGPQPLFEASAGASYLALTFTRSRDAADLNAAVRVGSTLADWTPDAVLVGAPFDNLDGTETVTYRDTVPMGASNPRRFMRVELIAP